MEKRKRLNPIIPHSPKRMRHYYLNKIKSQLQKDTSPKECASLLPNRTKGSIKARAKTLGIKYEARSALQITTLQNEYPILGYKIYDKYQNTIFKNKTRDAVSKYASSHNIPAPRQGRKLTPEETQLFKENYNKISLDEMEKLFPFLTRQAIKSKAYSLGLSTKRKRPILCVETSQVFSSFKEITQTMGLSNKNVWNAIHRGCLIYNKYHFKYLDDSDQTPVAYSVPNGAKKVRCLETNVIYPSVAEARRQTGIASRHALCGFTKTAGGYHWEYIEDQ